MAITNGYCTLAELKASLAITDSVDDTPLEAAVTAASRMIDDYTGRFFYADGTTQWCNVQLKRYKLDGGVYTLLSTNSYVAYDGFGWYEQGYNYTPTYDILHDEGTFFYYYDGTNPSSTKSI